MFENSLSEYPLKGWLSCMRLRMWCFVIILNVVLPSCHEHENIYLLIRWRFFTGQQSLDVCPRFKVSNFSHPLVILSEFRLIITFLIGAVGIYDVAVVAFLNLHVCVHGKNLGLISMAVLELSFKSYALNFLFSVAGELAHSLRDPETYIYRRSLKLRLAFATCFFDGKRILR